MGNSRGLHGEQQGSIRGEQHGSIRGEQQGSIRGEQQGSIRGEQQGSIRGEQQGSICWTVYQLAQNPNILQLSPKAQGITVALRVTHYFL